MNNSKLLSKVCILKTDVSLIQSLGIPITGTVDTNQIQLNGNALEVNSGNLSSGVQRIAISTDDINQSAIKNSTGGIDTKMVVNNSTLTAIDFTLAGLEASNNIIAGDTTSLDVKIDQTLTKVLETSSSYNKTYRDNFDNGSGDTANVFHLKRRDITSIYTAFMTKVTSGHLPENNLAQNRSFAISSSSTLDSSLNSGFQIMEIFGDQVDGTQISELVEMAGQTSVNLVNSYSNIYRIKNSQCVFTPIPNVGDIYIYRQGRAITNGVPDSDAEIFFALRSGDVEISRPAFYTNSNFNSIYFKKMIVSNNSDGMISIRMDIRDFNGDSRYNRLGEWYFPAGDIREVDLTGLYVFNFTNFSEGTLEILVKDFGTASPHDLVCDIYYNFVP